MVFLCSCNSTNNIHITSNSSPDSVEENDSYSESNEDSIYSYDFSGYYFETGFIDNDVEGDQDAKYQEAVDLHNGNYSSESDLDFSFQLIDEYNADYNDERYTVEIDRENYQMRLIAPWGKIDYFDIIWSEECKDFIFLRLYSNGGAPWYYVTKAAELN